LDFPRFSGHVQILVGYTQKDPSVEGVFSFW
jgi:hypothetical protein